MRRLTFLALGLLLALLGARVVAGAEHFAPYVLRDGLLLGGLGALVFAWNAGGWRAPQSARRVAGLPRLGAMTLLTGAIVALGGGVLVGQGWEGVLGLTAWLTWLLGLLLMLAGAWWPGGKIEYAPPSYRWRKDDAGAFVRVPIAGDSTVAPTIGCRTLLLWLVGILALAAFLRFWQLGTLPPGCLGAECIEGLRLIEGEPLLGSGPAQFDLFERLARLIFGLTGESVLSLRLAAAVLGLATVAVFFGAARRLTTPVYALLATLLLALSPWHLWASRSSDPWIASALLVTLALWLLLESLAAANARWWVPAGIALGLLFAATPALRIEVAVWLATSVALAIFLSLRSASRQADRIAVAAGVVSALGMALPILITAWNGGKVIPTPAGTGTWTANFSVLFGALLRPDAGPPGPFVDAGLLAGFVAALALLGAAVLLRHLRQPAATITAVGAGLIVFALARVDPATAAPASLLLAVLPFLFACAAVALDQLLGALIQSWARIVRPARLAAAAALVLLLLFGRNTALFMADLDRVRTGGESPLETDMARFIAARLSAAADPTTFVVPAAALNHPSLRLLAGPALAEGRVQALDVARTLPYFGMPPGDLVYLLPIAESQVMNLLRQLYPDGIANTELGEGGERALFNTFQVSHQALLDAHNAQITVYSGNDFGDAGVAQATAVPALDFMWHADSPLPPPYSVRGSASLIVPEGGDHTIAVEGVTAGSTFALKLDDILVLDTALGIDRQQVPLAQGVYRLEVDYRSGAQPADLRVLWQPPGLDARVIGSEALHLPMVPNQGLAGDYYRGDRFEGPLLARHKDLVVGLDTGLPSPYSVRWQGKLAIPRAGEYLIGTMAEGLSQLSVDGQLLIDSAGAQAGDAGAQYAEGLVYLETGWHTIEARYVPQGEAKRFRLLWQPAGAQPGELGGPYLLPAVTDVGPADATLPPPPPLADPRLGDDQFALSQPAAIWQPQVRIPPPALPPLPLETLWTRGAGCGAGANQLNAPHGLAFTPDGSQLYVTDTGNRRVVVYDLDGGVSRIIAGDTIQEPVDVDFAVPGGEPLILDATTQQILQVAGDDSAIPLPIQTTFYHPRGFDVDAAGNLIVADTGGARLVVLAPGGSLAGQLGGPSTLLGRGQPVDAYVAGDKVWAITAEDGRLWNAAIDAGLTAVLPTNTIDGPHLAGLPDGRFLATDPGRASFTLFSPAGQPLQQFGYAGQLAVPTGIAATEVGSSVFIAVGDSRQCTVSLWRLVE